VDVSAVVHTQARVARILRRLAPHAPALVLLEGGSAFSRRQVGLFWAAAVHCREIDPPCGACAACRAVTQDASRDLVWLRGEEGEIKVTDARALRQMRLLEVRILKAKLRNPLLTEENSRYFDKIVARMTLAGDPR
jgi:hypothetical protein